MYKLSPLSPFAEYRAHRKYTSEETVHQKPINSLNIMDAHINGPPVVFRKSYSGNLTMMLNFNLVTNYNPDLSQN